MDMLLRNVMTWKATGRLGKHLKGWARFQLALLVLAGSVVGVADGQQAGVGDLNPALRLTQYVHDAWQVEDGLPQNSVFTLLQSRDGYLWLGTQEGLVRFDGSRFSIYDRARLDALRSNEVRVLFEDSAGALWLGTNGGGLSRLHEGALTTYTTADGLSSNLVRALYEDRQGRLWVGTIDGGLNRFDGTTFTHYGAAEGLLGTTVLALLEDAGGELWVGTEAGLHRSQDGRFASHASRHALAGSVVWALLQDSRGALWVGTSGGLLRMQGDETTAYTTADGLCGATVDALYEDRAGTLWIGTQEGGLCRLRDGRFEAFTSRDGLTHNWVRALAQDREGALWIGTEGGGLNRLQAGKFVPVTSAEGLATDVVFSVLEDRDGALWVATEAGGLNRLHNGRVTSISTADGLPSDDVYALHEDRQGRLWIGMFGGGLCRLAEGRLACYTSADGLASDNVYAVVEDREGTLWIGTEAGLNQLRDGRITAYAGDEVLAHEAVTSLHEDEQGRVWVGTYSGLWRIEGGEVTRYGTAQGLTTESVVVLHEDRQGAMWAGLQDGGLCRLRDERIACATTREGLHNDNVFQILEDDAGNLWLGSNRGIFRISKQEFDAYAEGRRQAVVSTVYGTADGLKSSEAIGGTQPAAWRSRDGRLWFATIQGVASIDPANIRTNPLAPPVHVEQVFVNEQEVAVAEGLTLAPGSRDVAFHYTALSLAAPEKVRFRYMLEGYDEHWIDAGARREAYYTGLRPGTYRFRVLACNNDGVWNETGASVTLHLRPYFYQTRWFLALCVVLLAALAFTGHRLRIRQLRARERELERVVEARTLDLRLEKEKTEQSKAVIEAQAEKLRELDRFKTRFFANISHEFRTPLTMLVGPLENALTGGYGALPERMRQQVEIMHRNALRLLRLINQLLDLSKLEAGKMTLQARPRDLVAFLEGIVLSCTAFAERKRIALGFESTEAEAELYFEPDKLEKVFFNLLSNATKFTPEGGRIAVQVSVLPPSAGMAEGAVEVRVADTGKGIPAEALPYIFDRFHQVDGSNTREHEGTGIGLALVKELVLLHHGTVDVASEVGAGTTFTVVLPRGRAHLKPDELALHAPDEAAPPVLTELAASDFDYMHADEASLSLSLEGHDAPGDDAPLVLVVDDNKDVREYVAAILADTYRVALAENGEDGLARARALVPDLILSDVMMPRMDGNAFCRHVKADPALRHIPVVLLTARATHELKMAGLEVGADDHLAKPFNAEELRARVRNLLVLRRQEKELKVLNEGLEAKVRAQVEEILVQRRRYEADLVSAKEKAEASERLKSAILDNMNHEFRTPLTAILGFSEILAGEAPAELQEFAAEINQGGQRLMKTLDALLELSRLEAAIGSTAAEPFDLVPVAEQVAAPYRRRAEKRGLAFRFETPDGAAVPVHQDRHAVEQILRHLLDNAVKFTSAGEVRLAVGARAGSVYLEVADTGVGIGPEFLPHAFEAFQQESSGLGRAYEGVGLGLTVTRRLADLLGGDVRVASERGKGSVFTVTFSASLPGDSTPTAPPVLAGAVEG